MSALPSIGIADLNTQAKTNASPLRVQQKPSSSKQPVRKPIRDSTPAATATNSTTSTPTLTATLHTTHASDSSSQTNLPTLGRLAAPSAIDNLRAGGNGKIEKQNADAGVNVNKRPRVRNNQPDEGNGGGGGDDDGVKIVIDEGNKNNNTHAISRSEGEEGGNIVVNGSARKTAAGGAQTANPKRSQANHTSPLPAIPSDFPSARHVTSVNPPPPRTRSRHRQQQADLSAPSSRAFHQRRNPPPLSDASAAAASALPINPPVSHSKAQPHPSFYRQSSHSSPRMSRQLTGTDVLECLREKLEEQRGEMDCMASGFVSYDNFIFIAKALKHLSEHLISHCVDGDGLSLSPGTRPRATAAQHCQYGKYHPPTATAASPLSGADINGDDPASLLEGQPLQQQQRDSAQFSSAATPFGLPARFGERDSWRALRHTLLNFSLITGTPNKRRLMKLQQQQQLLLQNGAEGLITALSMKDIIAITEHDEVLEVYAEAILTCLPALRGESLSLHPTAILEHRLFNHSWNGRGDPAEVQAKHQPPRGLVLESLSISVRYLELLVEALPMSITARFDSMYLCPVSPVITPYITCGVHMARKKELFVSMADRAMHFRRGPNPIFTSPEQILLCISQLSSLVSNILSAFVLGALEAVKDRLEKCAAYAQSVEQGGTCGNDNTAPTDDDGIPIDIEHMPEFMKSYCALYTKAAHHKVDTLRRCYPNVFCASTLTCEAGQSPPPALSIVVSLLVKLIYIFAGGIGTISADDRRTLVQQLARAQRRQQQQQRRGTPRRNGCSDTKEGDDEFIANPLLYTVLCDAPDDVALAAALQIHALSRLTVISRLLGVTVPPGCGPASAGTVAGARVCAAVWRVCYQYCGILPQGTFRLNDKLVEACPNTMVEWIRLFPLYVLDNESKATMLAVHALLMEQRPLEVGPISRTAPLRSVAKVLHSALEKEEAKSGTGALSFGREVVGRRSGGAEVALKDSAITNLESKKTLSSPPRQGAGASGILFRTLEQYAAIDRDGDDSRCPVYRLVPLYETQQHDVVDADDGRERMDNKRGDDCSYNSLVAATACRANDSKHSGLEEHRLFIEQCAAECLMSFTPSVVITDKAHVELVDGDFSSIRSMLRISDIARASVRCANQAVLMVSWEVSRGSYKRIRARDELTIIFGNGANKDTSADNLRKCIYAPVEDDADAMAAPAMNTTRFTVSASIPCRDNAETQIVFLHAAPFRSQRATKDVPAISLPSVLRVKHHRKVTAPFSADNDQAYTWTNPGYHYGMFPASAVHAEAAQMPSLQPPNESHPAVSSEYATLSESPASTPTVSTATPSRKGIAGQAVPIPNPLATTVAEEQQHGSKQEEADYMPFTIGWLISTSLATGVVFDVPIAPLAFRQFTRTLKYREAYGDYTVSSADLSLMCSSWSGKELQSLLKSPQDLFTALGIDTHVFLDNHLEQHSSSAQLRNAIKAVVFAIIGNVEGSVVRSSDFWSEVLRGVCTTPLAQTPLFAHCCARTLQQVLCGHGNALQGIDVDVTGPTSCGGGEVAAASSTAGGRRRDFSFAEHFVMTLDTDVSSSSYRDVLCDTTLSCLEEDFTVDEKYELLRLITGRSWLPSCAKSDMINLSFPSLLHEVLPVCNDHVSPPLRLPTFHHCVNLLEVPDYMGVIVLESARRRRAALPFIPSQATEYVTDYWQTLRAATRRVLAVRYRFVLAERLQWALKEAQELLEDNTLRPVREVAYPARPPQLPISPSVDGITDATAAAPAEAKREAKSVSLDLDPSRKSNKALDVGALASTAKAVVTRDEEGERVTSANVEEGLWAGSPPAAWMGESAKGGVMAFQCHSTEGKEEGEAKEDGEGTSTAIAMPHRKSRNGRRKSDEAFAPASSASDTTTSSANRRAWKRSNNASAAGSSTGTAIEISGGRRVSITRNSVFTIEEVRRLSLMDLPCPPNDYVMGTPDDSPLDTQKKDTQNSPTTAATPLMVRVTPMDTKGKGASSPAMSSPTPPTLAKRQGIKEKERHFANEAPKKLDASNFGAGTGGTPMMSPDGGGTEATTRCIRSAVSFSFGEAPPGIPVDASAAKKLSIRSSGNNTSSSSKQKKNKKAGEKEKEEDDDNVVAEDSEESSCSDVGLVAVMPEGVMNQLTSGTTTQKMFLKRNTAPSPAATSVTAREGLTDGGHGSPPPPALPLPPPPPPSSTESRRRLMQRSMLDATSDMEEAYDDDDNSSGSSESDLVVHPMLRPPTPPQSKPLKGTITSKAVCPPWSSNWRTTSGGGGGSTMTMAPGLHGNGDDTPSGSSRTTTSSASSRGSSTNSRGTNRKNRNCLKTHL